MTHRIAMAALLSVSLWSQFGRASSPQSEVPAIATERPSVGTGPEIVSSHSLQVESGMTMTFSSANYAADLTESLLRLGMGKHTELRFGATNAVYEREHIQGTSSLQFQDIALSLKMGLAAPNHLMPQALAVALSCPTGSAGQTSGTFDPSAIIIWQQISSKAYTLTENIAAVRTPYTSTRQTKWLPSIAVGRPFSDSLSWYFEYAPTVTAESGMSHIVDGGLLYNRSRTSQFDLRFAYLSDGTGSHNTFSLGYSFRLDRLLR